MASTTTNYGWVVPTSSDLVKNGATAISTVGSSVDTSLWNVGFGQAGKNKIINGDFGIWQRGTSFVSLANGSYSADRWLLSTNKTTTISRQTFTPATAPVSGYESSYFLRAAWSAGGSYAAVDTRLEDVRLFAGQTITVSYWAKADATISNQPSINQNFGSGGSTQVSTNGTSHNITTSWARYSSVIAIPSISGKTIGTSSYFEVQPILIQTASASTVDVWGVQVEIGSVATPFQTASGSIGGELDLCERYYFRTTGASTYFGSGGIAGSTTQCYVQVKHPTSMRVAPTTLDYSLLLLQIISGSTNVTSASIAQANTGITLVLANTAAGLTPTVQSYMLMTQNNAAAYLGLSAEL